MGASPHSETACSEGAIDHQHIGNSALGGLLYLGHFDSLMIVSLLYSRLIKHKEQLSLYFNLTLICVCKRCLCFLYILQWSIIYENCKSSVSNCLYSHIYHLKRYDDPLFLILALVLVSSSIYFQFEYSSHPLHRYNE